MKLTVEPFTNLLGWSSDGSIAAALLNKHPEYIADRLPASTVFHVPTGSNGKSIEKPIKVLEAEGSGVIAAISGALAYPKMMHGDCETADLPHLENDGAALSGGTFDRTTEWKSKGTYGRKLVKTAAVGSYCIIEFDDNTLPTDMHGLVPGRRYKLKLACRVPSVGGPSAIGEVVLRVGYYDAGAWTFISDSPSGYDVDDELVVDATIPATATGARCYFYLATTASPGEIAYADEIKLESPVRITATAHPFANGDPVRITGVGGMAELNDGVFSVQNKTTNGFELYLVDGTFLDGSTLTTYTSGGTAERMTPVSDLSGYGEIVLSAWSRRRAGEEFRKASDFSYKVAFEGTKAFYLPVHRSFVDVTISLGSLAALSKVKVTALHDGEDDLLLSACYVIRDEYPLDILEAVKSDLALQLELLYDQGLEIGTASGTAGATSLSVDGYRDYCDRYAVLKIVGAQTETHQVDLFDEAGVTFMSTYDGASLKYTHAGAKVYLLFPVDYGVTEKEIALPGIAVWGMAPEPVPRATGIERTVDTFDAADTFADRREDQILRYTFLIDCEARQNELRAGLNRAARKFLGQNFLWINGRKHDFEWDVGGQDIEPELPVETIPKSQYSLVVEVREPREARQVLVAAGPATATYEVEQGEL